MSVVAKRLDGIRCHLVWRYASSHATVYGGDPATTTQTLAHVNYGETAGWIQMPLGTEVNVGQATLC